MNPSFSWLSRAWTSGTQGVRHSVRRHSASLVVGSLLFALLVVFFAPNIFFLVRPGEEAVMWKMFFGGTQTDRIYGEGLQIIWPWDKLYFYNVRIQQVGHNFEALAKNGLPIQFETSIRYQPIKESLPVLHREIGADYVDKVVKPEVQAHVRKIVANYFPAEIYTSEGYLLQIIRQGAMAALNERNISLDDLLIKRMELPASIKAAIERKLAAEQLSLQYDYLLIKERKEAERKRLEAMGIRDFTRLAIADGGFNQYLNFYGIEATLELAKSSNSKMLLMGNRDNGLPLVFNLPDAARPTNTPPAKTTDLNSLLNRETQEVLDKTRKPEALLKANEQWKTNPPLKN